jgi:thioredoxin-related protein
MKKNILVVTIIALSLFSCTEETKVADAKIYNYSADAKTDIEDAVNKAKQEGKNVLIQIGGNWCKWCIAFNKKINETDTLKSVLNNNYITYHLNYSKENWNEDVLAKLDYPQRFGFPVFVVLDGDGNRIHTQNSGYLEEDKGYDTEKVLQFFNHWTTTAIDPKSYPSKMKK